jgi:hypothetical protein
LKEHGKFPSPITLDQVSFKVSSHVDIAAGFVTLWALNYATIIAAGFALDTMLSLVGMPWLPFFLILWIIRELRQSMVPVANAIVNISKGQTGALAESTC